ncbi:hypothetical protein WN48_06677 [Eufriesea mexicana]|uniref:DUF5641 domain-containing protein n=1 Tax=Eufriesea mexicana TaxID=516756 RepID=A0A310SBM6_9HYME|nr:hypothetical protein WN48_06677 [Eufriesea mexicana]
MLIQIEACFNSRPLCPLTDDPTDLSPLTPGHFLIGDFLTSQPEADLLHLQTNKLNRYQLLQAMLQHFWNRWRSECFHQLQQRNKRTVSSDTKVGPGTLIIIKDDNISPLRWNMGRILELHPGADKIPRVASIHTAEGVTRGTF